MSDDSNPIEIGDSTVCVLGHRLQDDTRVDSEADPVEGGASARTDSARCEDDQEQEKANSDAVQVEKDDDKANNSQEEAEHVSSL